MVESGSLKLDRNYTARQKLSAKYSAGKGSSNTIEPEPSKVLSASGSNTRSLWSDPEIQKTIDCLTPEDRYKFSVIGEELFKTGGFFDAVSNTTNRKDPNVTLYEIAAQLQTMIRDGLSPEDLTDEEKRILISIMGPEEADKTYGLTLPDDVLKVSHLEENE